MARIVIIGSGLTGLSTAYHLEERGFHDYLMVEKEATVGGLCRSITDSGFTFDYTGHLLHASDPYFHNLFSRVVGIEHMNTIQRQSFIYSHDTYTHYPYQINLFGLPPAVIAECIEGYVNRVPKKKIVTFNDWVEHNFGAGFGKHFFFPYQHKIFSYDLDKLSASWTGRFVPQTSLKEMIHGALQEKSAEPVGYNANFWYPKTGGIQFWIDKFAQHVKKPVVLQKTVASINLQKKFITFTDGSTEGYETLVSTMPLDTLLNKLVDTPTTRLKAAQQNLVCNKVVNINLGIANKNISDKHWIYYPEEKYPFYRIGFYHNFAASMAPQGCSSLYAEYSYINESPAVIKHKTDVALAAIKKLFKLTDDDIAVQKILNIDHAYVIYNFWREKHLPAVHKQLQAHDVYSVGRYGEWKYASMQESVLDGKKIADQLTILPAKRDQDAYYLQPRSTAQPASNV